ncbi:D-alanyl-D-alanine carboxypeptidase family protein [Frankia sp. ACN1ag]|uniref:D-alanyl-D-alanine carboxypeptidase family protein n=1 Tax=Frankia sp. ACN1ag TaxID=102891 RepID=UPI0006DCAAC5|nr:MULTISPECIES: serine hydrolase [unclassified Frankia]KQC39337.1 D-alanyl-D-alanine carboxypeptidase [Frankia sp. ACN1ag]KQM06069.1 D-alanyl-D-alanine carboxypeptidase [Frankia sp. CpI1-P]
MGLLFAPVAWLAPTLAAAAAATPTAPGAGGQAIGGAQAGTGGHTEAGGQAGVGAPADPTVTPEPAPEGTPAPPAPAGLTAQAWLVADAGSGAVLAASRPHATDLPASTMKILTALTVLPGLPPDRVITVDENAPRVDGTKVGLVPGVGYTVRDLATAMMISSGNDAAVTLVEAAGGTAAVLARMNALARSLGARETVAGDPTGLDSPGQVTSVYDLAVLGRAALNDPSVRGYLTIPRASLAGRGDQRFEIQNHNSLLRTYDGAVGVKNGYTVAAGATFVGAATRGGRTLIVALLRAAPAYGTDARALLDWGFAHAGQVTPVGYLPNPAASVAGDATRPAAAAQAVARPAAAPVHRADHSGGLVGDIGPMTWIALTLTAGACVVTALTRRAARGRRRHRGPGPPVVGTSSAVPPTGAAHRLGARPRRAVPPQPEPPEVSDGWRRRSNARSLAASVAPEPVVTDPTEEYGVVELGSDRFDGDGFDPGGSGGAVPRADGESAPWGSAGREASRFGDPFGR